MVRKVSAEEGKPLCILGDLQGPKIRTGRLKNRIPVQLKAGQKLTITPRDIAGTATLIATTFPRWRRILSPERAFCFPDGLIELYVIAVHGQTRSAKSSTADCWASTRASTCRGSPYVCRR